MAISIFMDSTIEVLNSVDVGGIPTVACEMSDGNLAVGNQDGIVSIISSDEFIMPRVLPPLYQRY